MSRLMRIFSVGCLLLWSVTMGPLHAQSAATQDCAALHQRLSRLWQADSTQVFTLAEAMQECCLDAVGRDWGSIAQAQADTLLRMYTLGIAHDRVDQGRWLDARATLGLLRCEAYPHTVRPWLMAAILGHPDEPSLFFVEAALARIVDEYRGGSLPLGAAVADWVMLDRLLLLQELGGGAEAGNAATLRKHARLKLRAALPDCNLLLSRYADAIARQQLSADSCRSFLTRYELQGCDQAPLWEAALRTAVAAHDDAWLRRLAGAEAYNRGAWEEGRTHWLQALALEGDRRLQATDHLQVAQTWVAQKDYRKATIHLKTAMQLHPNWGEPIVRLMDVYLEGRQVCDMSTFDQRAVYWLLIELCQQLLQTDPNYAVQANERLYNYRMWAPSLPEAEIRGFRPGDTYPLKCWMSTKTTVPLN